MAGFYTPNDPHLKILLGGIFWEHRLVVIGCEIFMNLKRILQM